MDAVVAAPDKFRGTATAAAAAAAIAAAAERAGVACDACAMSDGGEGFADALGGAPRTTTVHGPLGEPVAATWRMRGDGTAVIEAAAAVGRALLVAPTGDDPVMASTYGVGELLADAVASGATRIVVGCGGTSSTDGGAGCVRALDDLGVAITVPLVVACDVRIPFLRAAAMFGPQKGASAAQVTLLEARLVAAAAAYLDRFGVDVAVVEGTGAGGGLAGGLVAIGGHAVSGASYVAREVGLKARIARSDLVVTGEGRVDDGTLEGKVVDAVLAACGPTPAIVVAGRIDPGAAATLAARHRASIRWVELPARGRRTVDAARAITDAVTSALGAAR